MRYDLKRPCPKCPFRTDIPGYLRPERCTEIAESLARGAEFPCHETTVEIEAEDGNDRAPTADSQFCAGALLLMEAAETPNQIMRVAERIGRYDPEKMDRSAPVARSFIEFRQHHAAEEEAEPECCSVANADCEAPAGYMMDGMVVPAEATGEVHECPACGEPVCGACCDAEGVCFYCVE